MERYSVEEDDYGYLVFDNEEDDYVDLGDGISLTHEEVCVLIGTEDFEIVGGVMYENVFD